MPLYKNSAGYSDHIGQFSRFLVVGVSNFAISFAVFYILYNHWKLSGPFYDLLGETGQLLANFLKRLGADSLDATLANIVGYGAGVINSFTWNKLWTFKARKQTTLQFTRFLFVNLTCLLLSSASLFIFTDYLNMPYLPVWFITMAVVTVLNFGFSKFWVFRDSGENH